MFESEDDINRRRILQVGGWNRLSFSFPAFPLLLTGRPRTLQRDLALLTSLGFSEVMCQKALFVSSGVHAEAMHWLLRHQHHPNVHVPWNMSQLQARQPPPPRTTSPRPALKRAVSRSHGLRLLPGTNGRSQHATQFGFHGAGTL
jgi:hypothetical protein